MDRFESFSNSLSQITMYDIKSMYNQAKNMVLNVSEMEAKVREATNDDPWGASSTLMQEIAQGTFNFHQFNEIMPCIYSRFMEKEARQWRQIYKALQLLEYLIKHGSERVVDDARAHISTVKMLRNFHYIDDKGKDEGLNVRNRAKELVELLSDVEKIRAERRRAKANKHKYVGTGNDGFGPSFQSGGSRYGGFGSDSLSYSNGSEDHYRSGASGSSGGFRDESRRGYEEYNAGDDEDIPRSNSTRSQTSNRASTSNKATPPAPAPAPAPVVEDLLGGFDDTTSSTAGVATSTASVDKALPALNIKQTVGLDDDDFADFQAAPVQATTSQAATAAVPPPAKPNLMDLLNSTPRTAINTTSFVPQTQKSSLFGSAGTGGVRASSPMHRASPSLTTFSSPLVPQVQHTQTSAAPMRLTSITSKPPASSTHSKVGSSSGSNFDDLWSMSLGSTPKPAPAISGNKSIKDLEKEKAQAALWGSRSQPPKGPMGSMSAFGSFGTSTSGAGTSSGGDDLLL
ncbi:hypothetical protein AMATHDRAFT_136397 [Amanita thiersii Skay4041]|uniref:ENTH domain-containing protein n=1 Tax=Amanita thiersii Skay4041 TaxID=703135 RepID=A0A2A9NSQ7_9AGAR|nr:hypothetical protein AMATHDRAFT_136397 [Amanita thiersii Skay4041]